MIGVLPRTIMGVAISVLLENLGFNLGDSLAEKLLCSAQCGCKKGTTYDN